MDLPREDKSELFMQGLEYAKEHSLDINNKEHVKQIATALDPQHTNDKEVEELMYQLKNASIFLTIYGAKDKQK